MAKKKTVEQMRFEEAFEELAALVGQLESGELPLEQSLALFERGQALAARCSQLLEQAELKLRQLVPDQSGGYSETDFEAEAE
ncbi:MAG: exodeoxyribonuclease VII small subunit [Chloroflexota bacterium]